MKKLSATTMMATVLGLALAGSAAAQQESFPRERTSAKSCADVNWNKSMLQNHPSLIDACQEVISVKGVTWARFTAKFVRLGSNDNIIFSVRDRRDRSVQEVTLEPTPGQVAYVNGRATPFNRLRTTDTISLYVPEGQYGFATEPGVPREQLSKVVAPAGSRTSSAAAPAATTTTPDRTVARRDTRASVLPATAGPLPWLALAGFFSMLGGLGLTLRRRYQTHAC